MDAAIASRDRRTGVGRTRRGGDVARHGAGQRLDVGRERRVGAPVPGGVVADEVDDRRVGPAGVVQVGDAVGEAGTEMQQRQRRPAGDPAVAVGGAGDDALEQAEDAAHAGDAGRGRPTSSISVVPGLAKHTSTPSADRGPQGELGSVHRHRSRSVVTIASIRRGALSTT